MGDRQTETGVKDAYTQYWIEKLIGWSRERQSRPNAQSIDEIEAELMGFVRSNQKEIYNPFLTLKCACHFVDLSSSLMSIRKDNDVNQDTPVEILHTILLGIVKYSWHDTHTGWKDPQKCQAMQV